MTAEESARELEEQFIELASKPRKVRTPEGAKKYGQPIGTIITADMIEKANKAPGSSKSSGANSSSNASSKAYTPSSGASSSGESSPAKPSLSGPSKFSVAGSKFSAPKGSRLFRPKSGKAMAYVRTPDGVVHAFGPDGEVDVPENLQDILSAKFTNSFNGDDLYEAEEFEESEDQLLSDLKPGTSLLRNGSVAFVKREDGLWENPDIGAVLSDADLQGAYDSGKFEVQAANIVEADFSKMTWDEIRANLDSYELGKELYFNDTKITKDGEGWKSEKTGLHLDSEAIADLVVDTDILGEKPKVVETEDDNGTSGSNGTGSSRVSDVPGSGGGNSGSGGSDGPEDSADEGDEPLDETHAGFVVPKETLDKIVDLLDESRKIAATKQALIDLKSDIKKVTKGWGIAEAKAIVDSIEKKYAFYVDGKRVRTLKKFTENDRTADIQAAGGSTPPVYHLEKSKKNAKLFRDQMIKSLEGNPYSASVYVYSEEEYEDMELFLADDGLSGIAIHNGDEIVSVFSTPESKNKKVARHLVSIAVQNGGKRLDAFDTVLPHIYAAEGFKVKSRLKWNDEYAPEGWDKSTFGKFNGGEPDVVFMKYEPGAENSPYVPGEGPYVDEYDEGLASTSDAPDTDGDDTPEDGTSNLDEDEPASAAPETAEAESAPGEESTEEYFVLGPDDLEGISVGDSIYFKPMAPGGEYVEVNKLSTDTYEDSQYGTLWTPEEIQDLMKGDSDTVLSKNAPSKKESSASVDDADVSTESQIDLLNGPSEESQGTDDAPGVEGMDTAEVESAIEALESHSGFQIKYGLKSLPDTHILKNQAFLEATIADAKEAFPNLSPKKALIAHLKASIGQTDEAVQPAQEEDSGPSILIGSDSPKNTATGVTGGSFSAKDIQDAVDILEAYDGKLFKAELNKKGNPLGQLSPNDIVGFNKDKTITKKKFIDLLKKKLADNQTSDASTDDNAEDSDAPETQFYAGNESLYPGEVQVSSSSELSEAPVGSRFRVKGNGSIWEKIEDDKWSLVSTTGEMTLHSDEFNAGAKAGNIVLMPFEGSEEAKATPDEMPEAPATPKFKKYTSTKLKYLTEGDVEDMPIGQKFVNSDGLSLTKEDEGHWILRNEEGEFQSDFTDKMAHHALSINGGWKSPDDEDEAEVPAAPFSAGDKINYENGHALISDSAAKKIGGQAGSNEGGLYSLPTVDGTENYYVKKAKTADHGNNEALANALYAELGVNAPEVDFASDGNLYSKIVDGDQDMNDRLNDKEWLAKVQKDFAIDAWLSNRDVFGMTYDNILTDADGNPWRIDNGGALLYRAMGEKKTDFGPQVTELAVFKTGKKAKVFGPDVMDKETERDGAKRLAKMSPERIREMVAEHNLPDSLADTLVARRQYILDTYKIDDPFAEQNIIPNFNGSIGEKVDSEEKFNSLPVGTVVALPLYDGIELYYTKREDGWYGEVENKTAVSAILAFAETEGSGKQAYVFKTPEPKSESEPEQTSVHDIAPGKYNTGKGAKAHLWVKPDGTGVYQGMKNKLIALDAEGVKKNYDAGMSTLVDTPDLSTYPDLNAGPAADQAAAKAKKSIPTLGSVDTLPDGTYVGPQGVKYEVQGDEVTVVKDVKSIDSSDITVGKTPDENFLEVAPVGTKISFKFDKNDDPAFLTKNEDGEWKAESSSDTWAESYFGYIASGYNYYKNRWKVAEFPNKDTSTVKKSSLKTKYLKGQLIDPETQTSVIPPGYSGEVTFYGGATTVASLDAYRKYMADPDIPLGEKSSAHNKFGVPLKPSLLSASLKKKLGIEEFDSSQHYLDSIVTELDTFLAKANVPEPQGLGDFLEKDSNGFYKKPLELLTTPSPASYAPTGEWSTYVKSLAASVGDGSIVGHFVTSGSKWDKKNWVSYLKNGDFAGMYKIENGLAQAKGKAHPSGASHPGHPANTATHQITWGAAVEGEIPAGQNIPGNWSSLGVDASLAEIDNYLILAKMQNPKYLSASEKRQWVYAHRSGNKNTVDQYSAMAQKRKNDGHEPLSSEPVWTDDIKPAKSYDSLFDDTQFPQNWLEYGNTQKASDFYADVSADEPELVALFESKKVSNPYAYESNLKAQAVNEWFAAKEQAYLDELNKPVYSVVKPLSGGSHPVFLVKDQFDRKKIFKPLTAGKEWRSENEAATHELLKSLNFNVPGATISEVNEGLPMGSNNKGILMDYAPNVGSFADTDGVPVDISTLTPSQFGQLASEHVADWFIDNDDSHTDNILVGESGDIVAIDKGRAFLQYGHWHGLDVDTPERLNVNTASSGKNVVYYDMITAIKSGKVSQEQMDAAYKAAVKAAKRIQKRSDSSIEEYVRKATANRTNWDVPDYAKDWDVLQPHPTNQDELVAAVLQRKNSMVEDIENMWTKLYDAAGVSKPEVPAKLLGEEHSSGWDEADLHQKVTEHKVWGVAPIHSSAAFANGASLLWTEKDKDGEDTVTGKFTLGNISQQKVLSFLSGKVKPTNGYEPTGTLVDFPTFHVKQWKKTVTAAGKNVSENATTGVYDETVWNTMKDTEVQVDADLEYASSVDVFSGSTVTFPSGVSMPSETVPQYSLALQHHKTLVEAVELARANKVGTDKSLFKDYTPPQWKVKGSTFTSPDGEVFKELDNGNLIAIADGKASIVTAIPPEAYKGEDGWTVEGPDTSAPATDPEKYSLINAGMYAGKLGDNGEKKVTEDYSSSGHPGKEYRIDLPTGETIYFRNGSSTGTATSQSGTVRFHLNKEIDPETSLANVQTYLDKWGIDTAGADEDSAEVVYWRQMFRRVIDSNTSNAPDSVQKAKQKLLDMRASLQSQLGYSVENSDIPEAIGLTNDNEADFWNSLAAEAFGVDKVNSFIADGKHLPQYQHMDLSNPEKNTGLPYFNRIDVDLDEVYSKGTMIAIGNNGKDKRHFDYIKSGGMVSTEERLRILGVFKQGASSGEDQNTGGANSVFTRIAAGQALKSGSLYGDHVAYWSPAVMAHTGTYSYNSDQYGKVANQSKNNKYNPIDSLTLNTSGGNETMVSNSLSIYDFLEIMVFEEENNRLKAIEEFKKLGIEELRGVPIEDRMVLRVNLTKAMNKIKAAWKS